MRILVLGSGGREHAIVRKLAESAHAPEILAAPGNGGTGDLAENVAGLDIDSPADVAAFARDRDVDLVVIGPEAPLVAGVADAVEAAGILAFGPSGDAARLEGSKEFAKGVMSRHDIPTGASRSFSASRLRDAVAYVRELGAPVVVKADGLAAGKGVTVATSVEEAEASLHECFGGKFGEAGERCLVEEFLYGEECSLLAFTDGVTVAPMSTAQDHKRAFDDDRGPNTGGMGVYSPVPQVDTYTEARMVALLQITVDGMRAEGVHYAGVIYGGYILTAEGPKVLEYNARFGDPETQVLLPRLESDLVDVMLAVAGGRLGGMRLEWSPQAALSVVIASGGYPGSYETGKAITGIEEAERVPGVIVYHAGTKRGDDGSLLTAGGRVLNVTALAPTMREARDRAYEAVERIAFDGAFHRSDIGRRALGAGA